VSKLTTIRERVERAAGYFRTIEGVVLTTFNLHAGFLEDYALPAVLGVDAGSLAARREEVHQRLGATPCTVFYDPNSPPRISGRYRYTARPVPIRGRFFHPKLVILAGRSEDQTTWVYLAVSSANLTLSGWGRNAESFGETWIHTRQQPSWQALDDLLVWLGAHSPLGDEPAGSDGVSRVRATLAAMPDRKRFSDRDSEPWAGALRGRFYVSVVHPAGFASFIEAGRSRRPTELRVCSPYWGDVAQQVAAFDAQQTVLIPALRRDGSALGLAQSQTAELRGHTKVQRNPLDVGSRFWHMKAYWIRRGQLTWVAVGSANFTQAGLSGAGGNVEAMLVCKGSADWFPPALDVTPGDLADEVLPEEEAPRPAPVAIVVAWDWRAYTWRWWLDADSVQRDFELQLPGLARFATAPGTHAKPGTPPPRGASFTVQYVVDGAQRQWQGQIVELNLDHSSRTYGRALTASEILESWRGRAPTWGLGGGGGRGDADDDDGIEVETEAPAAFDAVNLYDLYRSMRGLRAKLAGLEKDPEFQRAYLVGRPDSVMALAHLADRDAEAPVVRYLVLRELCGVISTWQHLLEDDLAAAAERMAATARQRSRTLLLAELGANGHKADAMLDWFEQALDRLNREAAA
jgi:hypothetical protein